MRTPFPAGWRDLAIDVAVPSVHRANGGNQFIVGVAMLRLEQFPKPRTCQFKGLYPASEFDHCAFCRELGLAGGGPER